jgi:hypothetical protein
VTHIDLQLDGEGCWPDLKDLVVDGSATLTGVALMRDAQVVDTLTGERKRVPAVTLRVQLADGRVALAQVKVAMLEMVLRAVKGRLEYLANLESRGGMPS